MIDLPDLASSIKVYPIPTEDILHVETNNVNSKINCEIINSNGQCMMSFEVRNLIESIDISEFAAGIYSVRFFNSDFDKSIIIIRTE